MTGALLTGEAEPPTFGEAVPETIAAAAAALWLLEHDKVIDLERDALTRLIVEGDCLVIDDELVPADAFEAVEAGGPDWSKRLAGYRIGKGTRARRAGVLYLGDCGPGEHRAAAWQAAALPYAAALYNTRVAAGHGLGSLAKLAAVIENATADRVAAAAGVRTGVVGAAIADDNERQQIQSLGVGSVPFLRLGEKVARVEAGPDKEARDYESVLEADAAGALNLPLSELKSDYSSGSFSNLRMAWQDAGREYSRRRAWWHRNFRLPRWREVLSTAIASGDLRGVTPAIMAELRRPTWPGPRREPPQPEKELLAVAALGRAGLSVGDAKGQLNE